jgi:uncharacterized protein DUF4389
MGNCRTVKREFFMSDTNVAQTRSSSRFPWLRMLYAIGFAVIAWVMLWIIVCVLAPLYFVTLAITGKANTELQDISMKAVFYMRDLLLFISGAREDTPFPLGPFPTA